MITILGQVLAQLAIVFSWIWTNIVWLIIKTVLKFIFYFVTFRFLANRGEIQDEAERRAKKKGSDLSVKEVGKVLVDDLKKTLPNAKTNSFDRSMKRGFDETKTSIARGKENVKSKFRKKKTKKAKTK